MLLWQTLGPGSLLSAVETFQKAVSSQQLVKTNYRDAVVILGYWRSGTTLLHELLCLDKRYTYPTTHACMNPHHFLLTEASTLARRNHGMKRPMDEMEIRSGSPQEDEFALLCLGARSPYEALLVPAILPQALKLADPRDLSPQAEEHWTRIFLNFLAGVSARGSGRPMILKSPTHGFRVGTLRNLLPDARFVLIVRDPWTSFESVVRMWHSMFETYAIAPIPADDEIREAVILDRKRFEAKLAETTGDLPKNRFTTITYESLIADPLAVVEQLYQRLELGDFAVMRDTLNSEITRRREYQPKATLPSPAWRQRITREWATILNQHAALHECT
jgi:omega-hydroxy-beta-dihydromenaquinone-9 sulfotransferase